MLKIDPAPLDQAHAECLQDLQNKVSGTYTASFDARKKKAGTLWDGKNGSQIGRATFDQIKDRLSQVPNGVGACNYCEWSEPGDIEHVRPKGFFPDHAFVWENYLFVCKQCNTGYKLDKAWIFPQGTTSPIELQSGAIPSTNDYCFINPRTEDPCDFLELELGSSGTFRYFPKQRHIPGSKGFEKAMKTLDILDLNGRDLLLRQRDKAFKQYVKDLREYIEIKLAPDHAAIEKIARGNPAVDHAADLEAERARILDCIKTDILNSPFPSVWRAMQQQVDRLSPLIQDLFNQAPEALTW